MFKRITKEAADKYNYILIENVKQLRELKRTKEHRYFIVKHPIKEGALISVIDFMLNMAYTYGVFGIGFYEDQEYKNDLMFLFRLGDKRNRRGYFVTE